MLSCLSSSAEVFFNQFNCRSFSPLPVFSHLSFEIVPYRLAGTILCNYFTYLFSASSKLWISWTKELVFSPLFPSPPHHLQSLLQYLPRVPYLVNVYRINKCFHVAYFILDPTLTFFHIWPTRVELDIPTCLHLQHYCRPMEPLPFSSFILCVSIGKDKAKVMSLSIGEGITDGKER